MFVRISIKSYYFIFRYVYFSQSEVARLVGQAISRGISGAFSHLLRCALLFYVGHCVLVSF